MEGLSLGSVARLPPAAGAAGSKRNANTGDRGAGLKSVAAVASARTGDRSTSVKSVAAAASARTGGRRAIVKSVAAAPSARTGGSRARVKSVAAAASARTGGSSTRAKSASTCDDQPPRHSRPRQRAPPRATRPNAAMRSTGMRCSTGWRAGVGGLERIGDAEQVVALLVQSEVSLANLGAFTVDELAAMGINAHRRNVSLYTDSSFLPKRRMQANLSSSDALSPRQREVLNTALSRARIHAEERRALAGHFAGHTMARRLCEAARRRQAHVTASARLGRYFDDRTRRRVLAQTRRHPACMRQYAVPPRGAGTGRKSAGTVVFTALPKLRCVTSQYRKKKRELFVFSQDLKQRRLAPKVHSFLLN